MKKFVLYVVLFVFGALRVYSQPASYSRNMEVSIVSVNHFEESRMQIIQMLDSIDAFPLRIQELKEGSNPMLFELAFYTNEKGFKKFDAQLSFWGHIIRKSSSLNSEFFISDTIGLKLEIERKRELLFVYEMKLAEEGVPCEELFKQIELIKEDLKSKKEKLMRARLFKRFPHFIILHLGS